MSGRGTYFECLSHHVFFTAEILTQTLTISYTSVITNNGPMIISLFRLHSLNAFSHERCGSNFRAVFFKRIILNSSLDTCCEVALRHPQSLWFINFSRRKCNTRYMCKVCTIAFCIMFMYFISICQIGHCYCFRNTKDEKDRPGLSKDVCHVYVMQMKTN